MASFISMKVSFLKVRLPYRYLGKSALRNTYSPSWVEESSFLSLVISFPCGGRIFYIPEHDEHLDW